MRSGFGAFSLPITAPQLAMILSSSLAVRAAMQGVESICSSVDGSVPVAANTADAAHTAVAIAALTISVVKRWRIDLPASVSRTRRGALRRSAEPGPTFAVALWTPDQQRTTPQDIARRDARERADGAAQHPGHARRSLIHLQRNAAVDHQFDAGDVFRFVGGEKQRRVGDVPGVAHMAHRHLRVARAPHRLDVTLGITGS